MLKQEAIKHVSALIRRVPVVFCSTLDFKGRPDTRAMQNLNSRFLFPNLQRRFDPKKLDTYLPVNTFSGKLLQIRKNPKASLYYYDFMTRESAITAGRMKIIDNVAVKASFWQPEWEKFFPGSIYGEEYSLVQFKAEDFKYYDGMGDAHESDL